jgi:hypothetical protein
LGRGGCKAMSDLEKYVTRRKKQDTEFASGYESGYEAFKFGVVTIRLSTLAKAADVFGKKMRIGII